MSLGRLMKSLKQPTALLMTPKIESFLLEHGGPVMDEDGLDIVRGIVEREKGNEGTQNRAGRFGASSRGTCLRRQVFTFLGMPSLRLMEPETLNLFNDGKWRHLRWQIMGIQSGALTHVEWPATLPKYRVKISMDGLNADEQWIFELKGDRNWSRILHEDDHKHALQIQTMLLVTGWDICSYVMEDKASQQWREVVVRRDPALIREVRTELEVLNEHVEDRRLPDILPACSAGEGPYRTCPFASQCLARSRTHGDYWPDRPGDWES